MPFVERMEDRDPDGVFVYIKKSKIKNAKKGLFTTKRIKKGEFICWYADTIVPKRFVDNYYYESDYLYQPRGRDFIIDASDQFSCYGRYANDSLSLKKTNAMFDIDQDNNEMGYLVAIEDIRKNSEVYVSYGFDYWNEDKYKDNLPQEDKDFINNELTDYLDALYPGSSSEEDDADDEDYDSEC